MTGPPYGVTPGGSWQPQSGPPAGGPWPGRKPSRTLIFAPLAIAVIAGVVAAASWYRSPGGAPYASSDPSAVFSQAEIDQARNRICDARDLVARATQNAGSQSSEDPTVSFIIALNVRLGATTSADYLSHTVSSNPAAPEDLVSAVQDLVTAYQETTLLHVSDAAGGELDSVYKKLDAAGLRVDGACGD